MYLNDHVVNRIETAPALGCGACDGLGCGDCPFKKSSGLGFDASMFAGAGGTALSFATGIPGFGALFGGIASLFGGGMTKEQKQMGPYLDDAKKGYSKYASGTITTPQQLLDFMHDVISFTGAPPGGVAFDVPWCPKWCPGSPCKNGGAVARGCQWFLPYNIYKQLGGTWTTTNPAYAIGGGGPDMVVNTIAPFFRQKLADPAFMASVAGAGGAAGAIAGEAMNYWPLLVIGGLVYLGSRRKTS